MNELVSIVITTYNRPELLKRAVNSVIGQTYKKIELIIIDDNSTTCLNHYIKKLQSETKINIIYYKNSINQGANYCRNKALELANGFYITGLDDDDYFEGDRIEFFIKNSNSNYAFICDNYLLKNNNSFYKRFNHEKKINLNDILLDNIAGNQIFVEKKRIINIGGYDLKFNRLQDHDAWTRLIIKYGDAYRFNKCSYVMDTTHEYPRITASIKDYNAYRKYYFKFKKLMSPPIKNKNLFRLLFLKGMKITHLIHHSKKLKIQYSYSGPFLIKKIMPWSITIKRKLIDPILKYRA